MSCNINPVIRSNENYDMRYRNKVLKSENNLPLIQLLPENNNNKTIFKKKNIEKSYNFLETMSEKKTSVYCFDFCLQNKTKTKHVSPSSIGL